MTEALEAIIEENEQARAELGISDALMRLSLGLEDISDLLGDIDQALSASRI